MTEMQLARMVRSLPPALVVLGVLGGVLSSGPWTLGMGLAAVGFGAYFHGHLQERVARGRRRWQEEGPPILVPRAVVAELTAYRHVTPPRPWGARTEDLARIRGVLAVGGPIQWCPCCQAIYCGEIGLDEPHTADCTRSQAIDALDALLADP